MSLPSAICRDLPLYRRWRSGPPEPPPWWMRRLFICYIFLELLIFIYIFIYFTIIIVIEIWKFWEILGGFYSLLLLIVCYENIFQHWADYFSQVRYAGQRFEFIFTSLVYYSPRIFTTIQSVYKAYDTSRLYRELTLRWWLANEWPMLE